MRLPLQAWHGIMVLNRIEQTYRELTAQGEKILKLFSGNSNQQGFLFPPKILEKNYQRYFSRQPYHPHPKGLKVAREAVAEYYTSQGCSIDPENILLTSGTSESFFYLFSLLTQPGDNIFTPVPSYPLFDHIAQFAHVDLRHYPLVERKNWGVDLEKLRGLVDGKTKAIILVSPHNPTGSVISKPEIKSIVEFANERGLGVISDEVFSEFYFGERGFPRTIQISTPDLAFTLNGISKMFALPGLKLSWIVVTGDSAKVSSAVDQLETMTDTFLSCHFPIQEGLPDLFQEGKEFLKSYGREVEARKNLAMEILGSCSAVRVIPPQGGFYLMGEIQKDLGMGEEDFVISLMKEEGVFVHPGYFYDYEKGIHFVISFLTQRENLHEGLERLVKFVAAR
jgi:aspartate/methionine/tyrosine aminotransferase